MSKVINRASSYKTIGAVFASLLMLCAVSAPLSSAVADDTATPQTTYVIATCQELQDISNDVDGDYTLSSNVDCSGFDFVSIGTSGSPFTGTFDGSGFTIQNISAQIFQNVSGATISNLSVTSPTTTTSTTTTTLPVTTSPNITQDVSSVKKATSEVPSSSSSRSSTNASISSASATTTTATTTVPPVTDALTIDISNKTSIGSQVRDLLTGSTLSINIENASDKYVTTASLKTLGINNAVITFTNDYISTDVTVQLLGTENIDVDDNGTKDITVELTSITTDRATIRVTPIYNVSANKTTAKDSNNNFWHYGKYGAGFVIFLVLIGSAKSFVTYKKNKE